MHRACKVKNAWPVVIRKTWHAGCQDNNYWCRNDLMHLDLSRNLVLAACDGGTNCINARQVEWHFIDSRPDTGLALPSTTQFAWHCRINSPWCATCLESAA
jgi:hypothetical protein